MKNARCLFSPLRLVLICLMAALGLQTASLAAPVELGRESFEAVPGIGYTTSVAEFDDAALPNSDFFGKFPNDGARTRGVITGGDAANVFMGEDLDTLPGNLAPTQFLTTNAFSIAGKINTSVKILLAAPGTAPSGTVVNGGHQNHYDWDATVANVDFVRVEASVDGGPFNRLIQFSPNTATLNQPLSLDADGDYLGGGATTLNDTFQEFDLPITTGNSVQVRVVMHTNATNEYILVDNIRIFGEASATAVPALAGVSGTPLAYTEGDAATVLAGAITVSDTDSANLTSASVAIVANLASSEDVLSATPSGAILAGDISYTAGTGTLTITRNATLADYQAVLRTVKYQNTNVANPSTANRQIRFSVNDGANSSNQPVREVAVTDVVPTQSIPFTDSFETDGRGTRYALDGRFTIVSPAGTFDRAATTGFTNGDGSNGIIGEDTQLDNALNTKAVRYVFNSAGLVNLKVNVRLGATGAVFDANDRITIEASVNGGAYAEVADFRHSSVAVLNTAMALDTNNDDVGDGTALSTTLQDFEFNLPTASSTLGLRILMNSNSLGEKMVLDRVVVTGDLPAPEIAVTETGVGNIPDNTGTFSFGTTTVGTPVTKTFTVTNSGTATLNLSALSLPSGFTSPGFVSSTVAASGGTTTFQVTMSTAAAATPSGTLSFTNNDGNENPYNFAISGTVNLPPATAQSLNGTTNGPQNGAFISWQIIFDVPVSGLSPSNFATVPTGLGGSPAVISVNPPGSPPSTTWNISVSTGTGDGTLGVNLVNDTGISHDVTNVPFTGVVRTIEKTAPTIGIGAPSVSTIVAGAGSVTYTVTYADTNFNASTLANGNITLNTTGTANGTVNVSGSGLTRTVTISSITGVGTLGISIAAGTASDTAGNTAPAAGPSTTFAVTAPVVAIAPNDLMVIAYNSETATADSVALLATANIPDGTTIHLTDRAWPASPATALRPLTALESNIAWVTSGVTAGKIIRIATGQPDATTVGASVTQASFIGTSYGTLSSSINFDPGTGDQLLIYTTADNNPESTPTFIHAFNADNPSGVVATNDDSPFDGWSDDVGPANTTSACRLPPGLTPVLATGDGGSAFGLASYHALLEQDNFIYSGPTSQTTRANWIARITTFTNWSADDTTPYDTQTQGSLNGFLGYLIGTPAAPTVTLSASPTSIAESPGSSNFSTVTATLSSTASTDTTVTLTASGTATGGGTDYLLASPTITIFANQLTRTTTVTEVPDILDEDNETVILDIASVSGGDGATESGSQQVTVTITDDDPVPSLSINDMSQTEGNSGTVNLNFTVTLTPASGKTVTVDYSTANNTATAGSDYTATSGTLTFTPGQTTKTVTIAVVGDTTSEPNETFFVNLTNAINAAVSDAQGLGTITNDDAQQVIVAATSATAAEGGATGLYTFTRTSTSGALTVSFQLDPSSTATAATDFNLTSSGTLTFDTGTGAGTLVIPNGQTTATVTLTALAESPNGAEAAETARLNVVAGSGYAVGAPANATVTITANSFLVTTTNDSGTGSLRQAVLNANSIAGTDTITFSDGTGGTVNFTDSTAETITLTSGQVELTTSMTVQGTGAAVLTVSGGGTSRVFKVSAGTSTLSGLTVTAGNGIDGGIGSGAGGGIYQQFATLTLRDCVVSGNTATSSGGGIFSSDPGGGLTLIRCTVSGNSANSGGGLFFFGPAGRVMTIVSSTISGNTSAGTGGGVGLVDTDTTIINSTISGNTAGSHGGGIHRDGSIGALLVLSSVTVTGNRCDLNPDATVGKGGGISLTFANTETLRNTIIAGNFRGASPSTTPSDIESISAPQTINTADNNVIGDAGTAGGIANGTGGNIVGNAGTGTLAIANVLNTTLASNGGPTQTHALVGGSPALNAGSSTFLPTDTFDLDGDFDTTEVIDVDQRGASFTRAIGTVDAGAFEVQKFVSIGNLAAISEGNSGTTNFVFTITRTGGTSGDVNMTYTVSGAAVNGTDFVGGTLPTGTATITTGNATTTVTIPVSGDTTVEPNEAFTVTLSAPDNGYVIAGAPATSTINNDDAGTVSIAKITDGAEANAPTNGKFRVTQTAASSTDTTVAYTVTGTATSGTDFTALSGSVIIPAGSTTADIDVAVLNDGTTLEPTETVILTVNTVTSVNNVTLGTPNAATMNLSDDDTATVTIARINDGVETPTSALFRVTQTAAATVDTVITYTTGGTATSGSDYTAPSGSVTILAGQTTADITVAISNDAIVEATETLSLTLTGFTARDADVSLGATVLATANITDNDSATVTIARINDGAEPGTNGLFRVTQTAVSSTNTTVTYAVTGSGTSGADFTALSGSVTILAGQTTADIAVAVTNDVIVEATETVIATLNGFSAGDADINLGATISATVSITDEDTATVTLAKFTDGVEAAVPTNALFRVTQTAASSTDTTLSYTVGGTAASGTDFTALSGTVTILAGNTTADISVAVLNENVVEATETVSLTLTGITSSDPEITLGATVNASADITDSDTATVTIAKITDGAETPTSALFRVTQTAAASVNTVLTYTVGGTATSGSDFTAPSGSVTILAGNTTADVSVTITNDALVEATETISLTLTAFTARDPDVSLGATLAATADITDNDSATVTLAKINDGAEPGTNGLFRVTQTAPSSTDTVVTYAVTGTATSGTDFTALSGSVTIAAGSLTADISVPVIDENLVESTETVIATLTGFTARDPDVSLGATVAATANIADNDAATVTLAKITDGVEAASPTNAVFRITQTNAASTDTTVTYTVGGTATSGSDFTALSGTVTILAGNTTADITVAVLNENVVEATETVSLTLNGFTARDPEVALGATLNASANITDSDTSVITLAAVSADKNEGSGGASTAFTFSATLSNPVQGGFTIAYTTSDGTALAASDYTDNDGMLAFTGTTTESKTITVSVTHDDTNEIDEAFTVALGSITGTTLGASLSTAGSPQTGTIRNDDAVTISIAATDANADENSAGTGTYRVTRNGVLGTTTVQLAIDASSTALATDWTQTGATLASRAPGSTGTIVIPAGNTFVDITLTPSSDLHAEAAETVRLNVTADAAYVTGSPANATVTIGQNDFVVINTNNAGEGTLRQAVLNAEAIAGANTITFEGSVFTDGLADSIRFSTSHPSGVAALVINSTVTIQGPSAARLSLSGIDTRRVLHVDSSGNVQLNDLVIMEGNASGGGGGGGIVNSGTLLLLRCTVTGNRCASIDSDRPGGGAIVSSGTLTIINSLLSNNMDASRNTEAAGAILTTGTCRLVNSTISGNQCTNFNARSQAGALHYFTGVRSGALTLENCTLTANTVNLAGSASGLHQSSSIFTGPHVYATTLRNTIIAGNVSNGANPDVDGISNSANGTFTSAGGNVIGNSDINVFNATNDLTGTAASPRDPLLGPLADNGGPTLTHALLNGSPAINNGLVANLPADTFDVDGDLNVAEALPVDQRGGVNLRQRGPAPDAGAVEAFAFEPTITASPTINEDTQSTSGLVVSANTADGGLTTHYQITGITGGTLYQNNGTTAIAANDYITLAQGAAGLKFTPSLNLNNTTTPLFGFTIQAAVGNTAPDLRGATVSTTISVTPVNDAPTVVAPGIPDQTVTAGTPVVVALGAHFADVDLDTLTFTVTGNTDATKATATLTGGTHVTLVALAFGQTDVTITADDSAGGTVTDTFRVFARTVEPLALSFPLTTNPPGTGGNPYQVNTQTAAFDFDVQISNTTAAAINGIRLKVDLSMYDALPLLQRPRLVNFSSPVGQVPAYVDHPYPVAIGDTVTMRLTFFVSSRVLPVNFAPVLTAERYPFASNVPGPMPAVPFVDATIQLNNGGSIVLTWPSVVGQWYRIYYSDTLAPNSWLPSATPLRAESNQTQWIDTGAPFTNAPPGAARFYRVSPITPP
ncbi:MAG: hypothetical protein IPK22_27945 [Verrucomicrobiaceae bacterium]|nr:hypothetical protein [Verrucomicrobiaceae bacterium]